MGLDDLRDAINLNTICDILDEEKKNDLLEGKALVDKEIANIKVKVEIKNEPITKLENLYEQFESGKITTEEYNKEKMKLLEEI